MPKVDINDNKPDTSRSGRTYDRSVKIGDPGGAVNGVPVEQQPFVHPDPDSKMLGPEWEKRSGCGRDVP